MENDQSLTMTTTPGTLSIIDLQSSIQRITAHNNHSMDSKLWPAIIRGSHQHLDARNEGQCRWQYTVPNPLATARYFVCEGSHEAGEQWDKDYMLQSCTMIPMCKTDDHILISFFIFSWSIFSFFRLSFFIIICDSHFLSVHVSEIMRVDFITKYTA